jgi:hypothetical protein
MAGTARHGTNVSHELNLGPHLHHPEPAAFSPWPQASGAPRVGTSPQWGGLNLVDLELNPVVCVDVDPEEVAATYLG